MIIGLVDNAFPTNSSWEENMIIRDTPTTGNNVRKPGCGVSEVKLPIEIKMRVNPVIGAICFNFCDCGVRPAFSRMAIKIKRNLKRR